MVDIPSRLKYRGGVNLPSREEVHIYKLPSYAKFTRKHEPVSEEDVLWMTRPGAGGSDPTRINEAIRHYARGVNPSVEVSYGNFGLASQGGSTKAIKSPYKLEVVRPPLFPVETTHSLSNPRTHQTISVETNPGLSAAYATNTLADSFDTWEIGNMTASQKASGPQTIQTSPQYRLDFPSEMSASYAINENRPESYEMMTNPGRPLDTFDAVDRDASDKVRKETLLKNIRPNFQVVVYDPGNHVATEVSAGVRQKNYIAVRAALGQPISLQRDDGTAIKLSDYQWTVARTNVGTDQLVLSIEQPNIELDRNLPLYATSAGLTMPTDIREQRNQEYDLEGKVGGLPEPTVNLASYYDMENMRNMNGLGYHTKDTWNFSFDNQGSARPRDFQRELPQLRDISRLQRAAQQGYDRMFD